MAADVVVARELKSLQEELSVLPIPAEPVTETPEERELRDQLRELANEVTNYFGEAEKTISAHPTESVVGALLVGILIGRLLGRR